MGGGGGKGLASSGPFPLDLPLLVGMWDIHFMLNMLA